MGKMWFQAEQHDMSSSGIRIWSSVWSIVNTVRRASLHCLHRNSITVFWLIFFYHFLIFNEKSGSQPQTSVMYNATFPVYIT